MYCETAKVRRVASMFKYYRKDPPLRLCGVLMSPLDWAGKKVDFFFKISMAPSTAHAHTCSGIPHFPTRKMGETPTICA